MLYISGYVLFYICSTSQLKHQLIREIPGKYIHQVKKAKDITSGRVNSTEKVARVQDCKKQSSLLATLVLQHFAINRRP